MRHQDSRKWAITCGLARRQCQQNLHIQPVTRGDLPRNHLPCLNLCKLRRHGADLAKRPCIAIKDIILCWTASRLGGYGYFRLFAVPGQQIYPFVAKHLRQLFLSRRQHRVGEYLARETVE